MLKTSLLNMTLRALAMGGRFVLVLFLARLLPLEQFGLFGLVLAAINLSRYLLGLEFHQFNTRELLSRPPRQWAAPIRDQMALQTAIFIPLGLLLPTIFALRLLPWSQALWFYPLLLGEHVGVELNRLLIARGRPLQATAALLLRQGAWCFALIPLMVWLPSTRSLEAVWTSWLIGQVACAILSMQGLGDLNWKAVLETRADWTRIRRGLRVAFPFFLAAAASTAVITIDRFFVKAFHGPATAGVYVFFYQMANAVDVFTQAGAGQLMQPKVVAAWQQGRPARFAVFLRRYAAAVTVEAALLVVLLVILIKPVLALLGKPEFAMQLGVFWLLLGKSLLSALTMVPTCALYARNQDRPIILSSIAGLAVAVPANLLLVPAWGPAGAAIATLAAVMTESSWRFLAAWRMRQITDPLVENSDC